MCVGCLTVSRSLAVPDGDGGRVGDVGTDGSAAGWETGAKRPKLHEFAGRVDLFAWLEAMIRSPRIERQTSNGGGRRMRVRRVLAALAVGGVLVGLVPGPVSAQPAEPPSPNALNACVYHGAPGTIGFPRAPFCPV